MTCWLNSLLIAASVFGEKRLWFAVLMKCSCIYLPIIWKPSHKARHNSDLAGTASSVQTRTGGGWSPGGNLKKVHYKERLTDVFGYMIWYDCKSQLKLISLCLTELFWMNKQPQCSMDLSLKPMNTFQTSFKLSQMKLTLLLYSLLFVFSVTERPLKAMK